MRTRRVSAILPSCLTRRQVATLLLCLLALVGCAASDEELAPTEPNPITPCVEDGVVIDLCVSRVT